VQHSEKQTHTICYFLAAAADRGVLAAAARKQQRSRICFQVNATSNMKNIVKKMPSLIEKSKIVEGSAHTLVNHADTTPSVCTHKHSKRQQGRADYCGTIA
jgi:hypothetical protein